MQKEDVNVTPSDPNSNPALSHPLIFPVKSVSPSSFSLLQWNVLADV